MGTVEENALVLGGASVVVAITWVIFPRTQRFVGVPFEDLWHRHPRAARMILLARIGLMLLTYAVFAAAVTAVILAIANLLTSAVGRDPSRTSGSEFWPLVAAAAVFGGAFYLLFGKAAPVSERGRRFVQLIAIVLILTVLLDVALSPSA